MGKATQPRETGPRQDKHRQTGGNQSAVIIIRGLGVTLCSSKRQDHQSGLCQVLKGSRVTPPKPGLEGLSQCSRSVPRLKENVHAFTVCFASAWLQLGDGHVLVEAV